MDPGDVLSLRIEKAVAGGRMLARHQGAVVLVAGAIPGETVEAVVEKVQRGTMWATARSIVDPSPHRVDGSAEWSCGGNVYSHVAYEHQLALKRDIIRDAFARLAHHELSTDIRVTASPVAGYRMRARLHRRGGRIGFFREGTHELCDAATTRQLMPATIDALERLAAALNQAPRAPVTEIELAENCAGTERACHLELTPDADPSALAAWTMIDGLVGVSAGHPHQSRLLTLWGSPEVTDRLSIGETGIQLSRRARAFFQGNRYLVTDLAARVVGLVRRGETIDLYAGVGLFSVAIAARGGGRVTAIEGDRIAAEDLKRNAAPWADRLAARHQSVEAFVAGRRGRPRADTVLVDPPRSGMTRDALQGALALHASRIVYVSCDVATLARDARTILDRGYRLTGIEAFDMFPNTAHVESVVAFDR